MKHLKGRFRKPLDPEALAFSSSLHVDTRLFREDIEGSIAHVSMLADQKIIPAADAAAIRRALRAIRKDIECGVFIPGQKGGGRFDAEDIHMAIEHRLLQKVGPRGGLLHTARSRNDQVALDERLYLRSATRSLRDAARRLQQALVRSAHIHQAVVMPGYTHLQRAQPVLLAHHLLAYVEMLERDLERFGDCAKRAVKSPLGAAALAGTPFPIDRRKTARRLGMQDIVLNSMDAVGDRDGIIEFIAACAITMMHLSRLAEELVLWTSSEWRFAVIGEAFTTGSSIMPQKQNPDMAELVRGKTGRVYGDLMALLTVMKGLPLAYNRDMQEDKEPLFDAADTLADSLRIMARMIGTVRFDPLRFAEELRHDFLLATELADYLVRKGIPFRKAHAIVGDVVRTCVSQGCSLRDLPLRTYRRHAAAFAPDLYDVLDPLASVSAKHSAGSTAPREVRKALTGWRKRLGMASS